MAPRHPRAWRFSARSFLFFSLLVCPLTAPGALAADWPAYKADAARSGVAGEALQFPLQNVWKYEPARGPAPAWPEPGRELHRLDFDYAFQPVVAGGIVCFGSSADDTVRALDAASGKLKWKFTTGGPIRFAPAMADGKTYLASDDGSLYCLNAATGKLVWRFRAAPGEDQLLGNGRMISRWPLRAGVLVVDGVAYVAAGMWPSHGIYVYALDAMTGKELWRNDTSGSMYINLPHGGSSAFTGVAPQGYMLATQEILLVPTGRSVPAAYDRQTGRLLHYIPSASQFHGGSWATIAGDLFFNPKHPRGPDIDIRLGEAEPVTGDGMFAYSVATGIRELDLPDKHRVLASGDMLYAVGKGEAQAIDLKAWREKRPLGECVKWSAPQGRTYSIALTGPALLLGGRGAVTALDAATGDQVWSSEVEGQVRGMAVSEGRLVVATEKGTLLCFENREIAVPALRTRERPTWKIGLSGEQIDSASRILRKSGVTKGYALVVGDRDSRLAASLASQSDLHVISALAGAEDLAAERERLLTTDLYGSRIAAQCLEDLAQLPYAPYFADLVVVAGDAEKLSGAELYRVLRPCGGVLCFTGRSRGSVNRLLEEAKVPRSETHSVGDLTTVIRGKLPGAGEWRYQWADGGKSGIGDEDRLRLPLDLLWFGGPGPDRMMSRHWGTSTPLSVNGRVFVTGQHHLLAFDAYNGRELWTRPISDVGRMGAIWRSANFVADDDSVYVTIGTSCHRLAQSNGKTLAVYNVPEKLVEAPEVATQHTRPVDVEWPRVWQVFGPFPKDGPFPEPGATKDIPEHLTVGETIYKGKPLPAVKGFLDFTNLYGGYGLTPLEPGEEPAPYPRPNQTRDNAMVGQTTFVFARIKCPTAGRLTIGAGADWWMKWYLDGEPIYDTLAAGNRTHPYAITNHVFSKEVSKGDHTLCAMVKAGSLSWCLLSAGGAQYEPYLRPQLPQLADSWSYLSVTDGLVLGTYETFRSGGRIATSLFALDKADGTPRWIWESKRNIYSTGIAFGHGNIFVLEGTPWQEIQEARRRGEEPKIARSLIALDLDNGRKNWRADDVPASWNHVQYANGVVLVSADAAYVASSGRKLWEHKSAAERVPLVHGEWVIAQPQAYNLRTGAPRMTTDLLTGEERPWKFARAYGCGSIVGCQDLLFFRSGAHGFYDLANEGTTNFGGVRPGCSVNLIPANGLVVAPEGSGGCTCSYNFQTSLALVPGRERGDLWLAFEGEKSDRPLKHLRLNLGAPGDRRDPEGAAWLGFPRPTMNRACPAPVSVAAEEAKFYYEPSKSAHVKGTDCPWLYTSGLQGPARIMVDLVTYRPVVVPTCAPPPAIDGKLDDPCWQGAEPVPFEANAHLAAPQTSLFVRRDAQGVYFGFRRKTVVQNGQALPFVAAQTGDDAQCWLDDEFEVFITDEKRQVSLQFGVSCAGGRFDGINSPQKGGWSDTKWNGEWKYAVTRGSDEWVGEVCIPLKTLTDQGLDPASLQLNAMSVVQSGGRQRLICLTAPGPGGFGRCRLFLPVVEKAVEPPERAFTVRLHFAELGKPKVGRRVFGVAVQDQAVLTDLDLAKEGGRSPSAIVKEFKGLRASRQLSIELTTKTEANTAASAPILSAIEITAEE